VSIESQHLPDNHVESATGANGGGDENALNIEERRESAQSRRLSSNLRVKYLCKNKKVTVPKTPNLRCQTRARKPAVEELLNQNQFKASTLNKKIFNPPAKPVLLHKHTQPKSPAFSLARTRESDKLQESSEKKICPNYYHPVPDFTNPFRPAKSKKVTKVESFSFDKRVLQKKYANSLKPDSSETESDSGFRAKPAPGRDEKPFIAQRGLKPATQPRNSLVPHSVEERMEKRHDFDKQFAVRSASAESQRKERIAKEEEKESKDLRSKTAFRANDVKHYKNVQLTLEHKSTEARSPKFSARLNSVDKRKMESLKQK